MKEIGSEFWDIPLSNNNTQLPFPKETVWYLSGRSALNAILDDICKNGNIKSAALPSWCCDSMIKPFIIHDLNVSFYPVYLDKSNHLIQEIESVKRDVILVLDYFGFHNCPQFKTEAIVIRDITHSVFSDREYNADYVFGSLRKWTGFYTGGFAWSNNSKLKNAYEKADELEYCILRKQAMNMKKKYIEKSVGDKVFLALFSKAEEWLDDNDIVYGSADRDMSLFGKLDTSTIHEQRQRNARYLIERLGELSFDTQLSADECPLFVPIFLENTKRNSLRKHLIDNSIYCPVHWGISEYHKLTEQTREIYDTELSIICDQRYELSDMERIADTIESF